MRLSSNKIFSFSPEKDTNISPCLPFRKFFRKSSIPAFISQNALSSQGLEAPRYSGPSLGRTLQTPQYKYTQLDYNTFLLTLYPRGCSHKFLDQGVPPPPFFQWKSEASFNTVCNVLACQNWAQSFSPLPPPGACAFQCT